MLADGAGNPARQRVQRRDRYDASAAVLPDHDRRTSVNIVETAFEVHGDRPVELGLADLEDRLWARLTRIVDEHVEPSPCRRRLFDDRACAIKVAYICPERERPDTEGLDIPRGRLHFRFEQIDQSNVEAGFGKCQ